MNKKNLVIGIAIVIIVIILAVLGIRFFSKSSSSGSGANAPTSSGSDSLGTPPAGSITQVASPQSAYEVALSSATQWEPDAALMQVNLGGADASEWTFIFVSQEKKGKGFQVVVSGQTISSSSVIAFEGSGTALPANAISPDAAMAEVRSLPGYADVAIVGLQMVYNAAAKQWYWGVKTASGGTITIKATP
jgi:hypothetical protein